ncbi:Phytoene desaturase [Granulibacter bethesdensis]|nr:Phytoene desaturase [Granulibacter bethesdensis]
MRVSHSTCSSPMFHIVGGGLAGLSAALDLAERGQSVTLYESSRQAGGRCRSYFDKELGCRIDNGNHLLLSGNRAAHGFLQRIGASDSLSGPGRPLFPFADLTDGSFWSVQPGLGRLPLWLLKRQARVAGTKARDYLSLLRILRAKKEATVQDLALPEPLFRRLLEPLAVSALNTRPHQASASLFGAIIHETLAEGGSACIPAIPREGMSESFVDPALTRLSTLGAEIRRGHRIASLTIENGRVVMLGDIRLGPADKVILAVPAWVAADLLPGLTVPDQHEAIINLHFRTPQASSTNPDFIQAGFIGVVGGTAEWIFRRPEVLSVTISAANHLLDDPDVPERVWDDIRRATGQQGQRPKLRIVREKRATFLASPAQNARRPQADFMLQCGITNLALAGDWTATGLPATIEGAIRSGSIAVKMLLPG